MAKNEIILSDSTQKSPTLPYCSEHCQHVMIFSSPKYIQVIVKSYKLCSY